jgi:membrane associated rhomboid family serine protease
LAAYEEVNRDWPPPPRPARPEEEGPDSASPAWVAGMLVAFYLWLGPYRESSPILRQAASDTARILAGDWWRVLTALTVHSDAAHLLGNLACLYFLGGAVCRALGAGAGWCLLLLAAATGNAAAAYSGGEDHVSVGASTACFAAVGVLAARETLRRLRERRPVAGLWDRAWLPLAAGVALLTALGTGPRADLGAHAYGFLLGGLLSAPTAFRRTTRLPAWAQSALLLAALCSLMAAWRAALAAAGR